MSTSIGQDEPHRSPKKAYFVCAIGVYFMSFFYEHPVVNLSSAVKIWNSHNFEKFGNSIFLKSSCGKLVFMLLVQISVPEGRKTKKKM